MANTMDAVDIGPRMRLAMKGLTNSERSVLKYCLSLGAGLEGKNIGDIASQARVSTALVVKVAKKCGFTGFKRMKSGLVSYSRLPGMILHEELGRDDSARAVADKVFNTAINALQETSSVLDVGTFERAADTLCRAKRIDVYGVGGSGALVLDCFHKFLRIGVRTNACTDTHQILMLAASLEKGDAVLGFSHSGQSKAVVDAFAVARSKGVPTIAITNTIGSPMAELAQIALYSVAQGSPITGENAAARVAQLTLFDVLFVLFAQRNYRRSMASLEKAISAVSDFVVKKRRKPGRQPVRGRAGGPEIAEREAAPAARPPGRGAGERTD
jgi:RpiR family transcriptional regulator, repressor of rpiB and als operon